MKKIFVLLLLIGFSSSCVLAQDKVEQGKFKQLFKKKVAVEQAETTSDDNMSPSQQAVFFYGDNNIPKSFELLIAIPEDKRTAQDWLLLGNLLQDQDRVSDAIFMYQRAILVNPKFYKPYYNLGNVYLADEKPFMAIENYRKANKINPEFAYGYYNLGCAYIQAGELKKAKIAFLKAIELKNSEPEFYYNLAYTYKKLDKAALSKQYLNLYNKAMELKGN